MLKPDISSSSGVKATLLHRDVSGSVQVEPSPGSARSVTRGTPGRAPRSAGATASALSADGLITVDPMGSSAR